MASRKITRSAKKAPASASARPAAKAAAKAATKVAAKKSPAPAPARPAATAAAKPLPIRQPLKPTDGQAATSRAEYLQAGLEALVRRIRLRDQAEAKKLEPALAHLAKAYGKLLGKA
jgi:hypothetical protein